MNILIIMKIHDLILEEETGSPKEISKSLYISDRNLHYYISFMKDKMKAPIVYDAKHRTYRYNGLCELCFENTI